MEEKEKNKSIWALVLTMLKIGLVSFGGGYAMISVFEREFVEKKKWLTRDEYYNILTVAESTPGPIAINSATYIGYKTGGFIAALLATLSVCVAPFTIIFLISLFFDSFMDLEFVAYAFDGIRVAVAYIILKAGLKMVKDIKKTPLNIILFAVVTALMVILPFFSVSFSSVFVILIAAGIGIITYFVKKAAAPKAPIEKEGNDEHLS